MRKIDALKEWKMGCLLLLLAMPLLMHAQEKDFNTWIGAGAEYKLSPALTLAGGVEWRTKDDLSRTDRWSFDASVSYKLLPFLKLGANYELHYRNRGDAGWKFRNRYSLDGTLSTQVHNFKLSLRERFQHTFDGRADEFRLRSRLKVGYDLPKTKVEPYVSVEMYNGLNDGDRFGVKRMRYRGGISLPICSQWEADVYYCRQWEEGSRKNILGAEVVYKF